jgi:hypothetical protein
MCVAVALTRNRGDGGALMDSVEVKQSPVTRGGQMTLAEGGEAFVEWEQGEDLTHEEIEGGHRWPLC